MDGPFIWGLGLGAFGATVFLWMLAAAYRAGARKGTS
jgi:hypothetical protein